MAKTLGRRAVRCFYSPDYFLPLPEGHPFPMRKFPEAHALLGDSLPVEIVGPCADEIIQRIHQPDYLARLRAGGLSSREITQLGLPPGEALYRRSALEVEGTRRAAWAALEEGIAANLAGGTHHAFPDHGEGFCVLNDVAITIADLHASRPDLRVFVCDTDAHQGNGTHAIFSGDARVFTYSIHVGANYPSRKVPGTLDVPLDRFVSDETYLAALARTLPAAVDAAAPSLAFWIAGADPHRNDRFGQMQLSARAMRSRDRLVASLFRERRIPLVLLYGGGYNREVGHTARLHAATVRTTAALYA